jgi:hypothetical protein
MYFSKTCAVEHTGLRKLNALNQHLLRPVIISGISGIYKALGGIQITMPCDEVLKARNSL